MHSLEEAIAVATAIAEAAQRIPESPLMKIHLFGSVIYGSGRDIDIALEIPFENFANYAGFCAVVLDGVDPLSKRGLLKGPGSARWEYLSPKSDRTLRALAEIGLKEGEFTTPVNMSELDVICLPVGWDTDDEVSRALSPLMAQSYYPDFFQNLRLLHRMVWSRPQA